MNKIRDQFFKTTRLYFLELPENEHQKNRSDLENHPKIIYFDNHNEININKLDIGE